MQNRPPPSQEDVLLFRTITEADDATSAAYLRANTNITEALNAFFNNRVAQIARSQTMPTMSTSNRPSQPQPQATQVRTQSQVPVIQQQSASTSRHRSRSRKSKKDRRKSAAPATGLAEVNSDEKKKKTVVPKKKSSGAKRTFSDMINQCMQANLTEEAKKKKWPKYLGSLKVECELELHMVNTEAGQIDVGDAVSFNIPDMEFRMSNFRKTVPTYTIKGSSLLVEVHNGKKRIGYIRCAYEEMFYFLLHMKYITMEGTVMTKPALPGNGKMKMNRFETRVDIFLTEWVISNPLNIMATRPGRKAEVQKMEPEKPKEDNEFDFLIKKKKKNNKKEEDPSEEEQKTQQIARMAKESFIKLFYYLQIKINIPTVVQLKKRADPFNPVRRDKYGGYRVTFHDTHIYCYDKAPELIATDYPIYYERKNQPKAIQQIAAPQVVMEEPDSSMEIINIGSAKKEENPEETKARIEQDLNELEKKLLQKMTAEDNAMFSQKPKKIDRRRTTHAFGTYAFEDESSEEDFEEYNSDDSEEDNKFRKLFKSKSEIKDRNRVSSSPPKNQEGMMPIDNPKPAAPAALNNDFYNPFQGIQQNRAINHDVSSSSDDQEGKDGIKSHLNDLFNLQNQNSNSFSLSEPPKTFKSTLHMYQKQALTWMKYREGCLENQRLYDKLNEEIRLLNDLFEEIVLIDGSKIYFNPFNGEITLDFPLSKPTRGGILADEMGLGKTVMTIALIHAHCREAKKKEEKKKENSQKKKGGRRRRGSDSDEEEDEEEQQEPDADDADHGSEYDENDIDNIASKRGPKKNKKVKKTVSVQSDPASNGKAGTLIVVPVTVLSQWEDEIYTHSHEGTMKVLQYYGGARSFKKTRIEDFDVVLTTYGVLSAELTKKDKENKSSTKCLFDYEWFRVILDEAHNVKEKSTRAAKAACGLNTSYRWCLSGTPIQNKIDDIFSIIKFLRVDTWCEYFLWNTYINKHVSNEESFELLRNILRPILLRRTKKSTYSDGTCILSLPPKEINTHTISLTTEEKQIYDYLFYRGKNQFDQIVNGGTLQYEYAHVFELLMRLRQVCNHPGLVFSGADLRTSDNLENAILKFLEKRATSSTLNNNKKNLVALPPSSSSAAANKKPQNKSNPGISSGFVQDTIDNLKNKRLEPCTVCLDDIMEPVVTNCCHVFCRGCISDVIERLKSCPICRKSLTMADIISVVIEDREDYAEIIDIKGENFKKSSKLIALFEHVHEIRKKKEKVIVFSQFLGMLNLIQKCLEEEKIPFRRIDGSCTQKQRADYIEQFNEDEDICVFMISLKAGAVGLNLTVANHVILVDPWWNPAIEDQAIERVHRIGQKKKVFVTRLICDKTIEARIVELHSVKKGLVNMTLQFNPEQQKKQNMENMIHLMKRFDDQS